MKLMNKSKIRASTDNKFEHKNLNKLTRKLKKELNFVPMPAKNWETRIFTTIVAEEQRDKFNIALLFSKFFYSLETRPILIPVFSFLLLAATYWVQPLSYWTPPTISTENSLNYVEDMTALSYYEPTIEIMSGSWIIEDY